jgi:hypothetical protein
MDRHSRQARLATIGVEGQARIARAFVDVGLRGFGATVAVRYLAGAGVRGLRVPTSDLAAAAREVDGRVHVEVDPSLPQSRPVEVPLSDPAARELAQGAIFALRALRSALERAGAADDSEGPSS